LKVSDRVPDDALEEIHELPNGNFSKKLISGYALGFDLSMLGRMRGVRRHLAETCMTKAKSPDPSILDLGCGAAHLAKAFADLGARDLWGLDSSPYQLQVASRANRAVRFVQGLGEDTGFPPERF